MPAFDDVLRTVDDAFVALSREKRIPGVAWGVIRDGVLAHAAGTGVTRDGGEDVPDADTVFRIASMTKSFTASAILLLRDEGRLRLDDPVADHVPALAAWALPTRDSAPITIRQLLTMSAGLPTDDPWGDRQQALPLEEFDALLRRGPVFAWPPDTTFEYSNLGYGILGRVVTAAAGREYREVVRDRLMGPLGMTSSGFEVDEIPLDRLAHGYARVGEDLVREGEDTYGALASMGGLYSTVRDLARWVGGFLDAFPARDDPEDGHPLRRASRREMQQAHRTWPTEVDGHPAHDAAPVEGGGYGYGLWAVSRTGVGTIVGHGGGYPGYGTQMVWHPATGLGVVAAGNLRYAGVHPVALAQLAALVGADGVVARRPRPMARVTAAVELVGRLIERWDDAQADAWFAMNMDLDEPRQRRRQAVAAAVQAVGGPFQVDDARPLESDAPAHRRWWLRGERGWLRCGIQLSPEPVPLIQALAVTAVVEPSPALRAAGEAIVAAAGAAAWPVGARAAATVDRDVVTRGLSVVAGWLGEVELGPQLLGDGTTTATWELVTPGATTRIGRARARLAITLDAASGELAAVTVEAAPAVAPAEGW
ncbi:MAG TPA: serine hydrolase domain-containing protein [Candidatus Limnocylindrales bacterium]|nr:serine hydrolase domain-containing protein [Candidatus Limnocylindrales bacterium]